MVGLVCVFTYCKRPSLQATGILHFQIRALFELVRDPLAGSPPDQKCLPRKFRKTDLTDKNDAKSKHTSKVERSDIVLAFARRMVRGIAKLRRSSFESLQDLAVLSLNTLPNAFN